ncbi:hypothetical protein GIY62_14685 [Burkholderia plantarii]|uniref:hypothetical protein n=1 Tax=Burkholderia plantarii TaxID=41899 RepID=UPI00272C8AB6|nr:hypothetical protein [Burkholderia plantarii]WLE58373.1 hypothetical protein GIY62_14685 [Burkholderia plantarii]
MKDLMMEDLKGVKGLVMRRNARYPAPAPATNRTGKIPVLKGKTFASTPAGALAPQTMARIEREARSMQLTSDQLVDRALLALADEVDADRCASRARGEALPTGDGPR